MNLSYKKLRFLKIFLVICLLISTCIFNYNVQPVNALTQTPKLLVENLQDIYQPSTAFKFTISTQNYTGNVQYFVSYYDYATKETVSITNAYSKSFAAATKVKVNMPAFKAGKYRLNLYVKKSGTNVKYDSTFVKDFTVENVQIISKANTSLQNKEIKESLLVQAANVKLSSLKLDSNFILDPGTTGKTTLTQVSSPNLVVKSSSKDGISLNKVTVTKNMQVTNTAGKSITLTADKNTLIKSSTINSSANLNCIKDNFGDITIADTINSAQLNLDGSFTRNIYIKSSINLTASKKSTVQKLIIEPLKSGTIVYLNGTYGDVEVDKNVSLVIGKSATIGNITANAKVDININKNATVKKIQTAKKDNVTLKGDGSKTVKITLIQPSILIKQITDLSLTQNDSQDVSVITTPDKCSLKVQSSNLKIASVSLKGAILTVLAKSPGNAVVTISATKTGYKLGTAKFKVVIDSAAQPTQEPTPAPTQAPTKSNQTVEGTLVLSPLNTKEGAANTNITLSYVLGEKYTNGTVTFTIPAELKLLPSDIYNISDTDDKNIEGFISGQNVTIDKINADKNQTVTLTLLNRAIPKAGNYIFKAVGDADGKAGTKLPAAGKYETKTMKIGAITQTKDGVLAITPGNIPCSNNPQTIYIVYILGQKYTNGKLTFTLEGLTPSTSDTISIAGNPSAKLASSSINGSQVVVSNINADEKQTITLTLTNKSFPNTGAYYITAVGDSDGTGGSYSSSSGKDSEMKLLIVTQ